VVDNIPACVFGEIQKSSGVLPKSTENTYKAYRGNLEITAQKEDWQAPKGLHEFKMSTY
jgi:hypothetical protein